MKHTNLYMHTARSIIMLLAFLVLTPPDGGKAQNNNFVTGNQMPIETTATYWRFFLSGTTIEVPTGGTGNPDNIISSSPNLYNSWDYSGSENITITINRAEEDTKPLSVLVVKYSTNTMPAQKVTVKWDDKEQEFSNIVEEYTAYLRLKEPISSQKIELVFQPSAQNQLSLLQIFSLPSIQHKAAKWHDMRTATTYGDTFDKTMYFELTGDDYVNRQVQATHVMTDTIYMRKGTRVNLTLPNKLDDNQLTQNSMNSYIRWYSYRTGTTYLTEHRRPQDGRFPNVGVYDLLTPANPYEGASDAITRFDNGYLLLPFTTKSLFAGMNFYFPTDDEFKAWFPSFENSSKIDNNLYVVACDVSQYTDYGTDETITGTQPAEKFKNSDYCEPTLTHRLIYYIKAVEEEEPPYEEYTINMPATRVRSYTTELVTLSKMARNYLSQNGTEAEATLVATIEDNIAGIELCDQHDYTGNKKDELTLTGTNRNITFRYPYVNDDKTRTVIPTPDNGQPLTATIIVKPQGSDKVVAKFHLNFVRGGRLLTQSMVKLLDGEEVNGQTLDQYSTTQWATLGYRTPKKIDEDPNNEVLTELTMDYDKSEDIESDNHIEGYYPYPLAWNSSSYGFYDGTKKNNGFNGNKNCAEWGNYAITTKYVECAGEGGWENSNIVVPNTEGKYEPHGYHLFIDASDRPGTIFRAPFRKKLCSNAQLTFSAWVKVAREGEADNAGMLISIMGKTVDENGNDKYEPVYRYLTGQIPATYQASANLPGFSTNPQSNEWFHIYFTFTNNTNYDQYYLQVDNYSASTKGADMYLDDIKCYMAKPKAHVKQKKITCDEFTLMTLALDWETLLARIGKQESEDENNAETASIDFCFVDSLDYAKAIYVNKLPVAEAIEASWMPITKEKDKHVGHLSFNLNFSKNDEYDENKDKSVFSDHNNQFYRTGTKEDGNRQLIGDFYSALQQNRRYMILIRENQGNRDDENVAGFTDAYDDCSISASFSVESRNQVLINGEVLDPEKEQEYCVGQTVELAMRLRVEDKDDNGDTKTDENGNPIYKPYEESTVYYDWYFNSPREGTEEDFETQQPEYGSITVKEALVRLREHYPSVTAEAYTDTDGTTKYQLPSNVTAYDDFTDNHIKLINTKLNEPGRDAAVNRRLILRREKLTVRLLDNDGRSLKIIPIPITEDEKALICAEPVDLRMTPFGSAPSVQPGFEYMNYPEETYNPAMRIGLKHIENSTQTNQITVNLRNIKYARELDEYGTNKPTHVGLMSSGMDESEVLNDIYLIGSTDPAYKDLFTESNSPYTYVIGKVHDFYAQPRNAETPITGSNVMKIHFTNGEQMTEGNKNLKFDPKEGYEYTFMVRYEEQYNTEHTDTRADDNENSDDDKLPVPCYGNFIMTMKVVPEYLVWQGKEIGLNWNDDSQWKRATNTDIHANNTIPNYGNNYNDNPGYVPMRFSKIIMPKNSKVELYKAEFEGNKEAYRSVNWKTERPDHIPVPSNDVYRGHPIQYDMMVYGTKGTDGTYTEMKTDPYTVNRCEEVHFESGAEMMHAELLHEEYKKAWVEYELEKGRWYALSSPLQNVFSGDFYTGKDGTEASEYFKDINWSDDNNSRLNPTVYQRGWKGSNATMMGVADATGERAIVGNWSALYNKIDEDYSTQGFSLRVQDIEGTGNTALFRLPKADESYTYNGSDRNTPSGTISRENSQKLRIDNLDKQNMTVSLEANGDNPYYLVGNPFMAHLKMDKFFEQNTSLANIYWLVDESNQQIVVNGSNATWTTNGKENSGTVPPLHAFFVKKAEGQTVSDVTFTVDMQALGTEATTASTPNTSALYLTVTTADGRQSHASVAYDAASDKGYRTDEDAELFLDSNLGNVPMVYTVAGTMAASVNRTSDLYDIPVGVYGGDKASNVVLSFDGLESFSSVSLYDAVRKIETPLHKGKKIEIPAATAGRYFLRASMPTANETIARNAFHIYTIGREQVVVTAANAPLKAILVHTVSGKQVRSIQADGMQWQFRLPTGLYLVTTIDKEGLQETEKIVVK